MPVSVRCGAGPGDIGLAVTAALARGPKRYATMSLNTPATPPRVTTVTTNDGADLRIHTYGPVTGRPIVFSHGWCERIDHWNPQINALSGEYRVIAYDHRGHGNSTMGSREPAIEVLADDLALVLDATLRPGERAVLVGHSMGAMTLMSWSLRHPEQHGYAGAVLLHNTGFAGLVEETSLLPGVPVGLLPHVVGVAVLGAQLPFPPVFLMRPFVKWRILGGAGAGADEVDFCARMFN